MRRAKIVCTLGPASSTPERLSELVAAGMDVARLNMSHGDYADHLRNLRSVREAAESAGRPVGVLADLQGPKIRLGRFANGKEKLTVGAEFAITIEDIEGTVERCSTTYKGLPGDVRRGDLILIDDGRIALRAVEITDTDVITEVTVGGPVSNNKGINLPGVGVSVPAMSAKDSEDLRWALRNGVDMVALSFVRSAEDIKPVHAIMDAEGRRIPVIAKMEKPQAVENLREIIDAFDAFMVARGDLGVELPLEEVPLVQKQIVTAARRWAKPVIVATQMLESMISSPRPTRAEASDVANAILDGADAVMLSGETSVGEYPVLTVADHGTNRREHRGPRHGPDARHRLGSTHHQRRDHQSGRRGRTADRCQVSGDVYDLRRLGPPLDPTSIDHPGAGLHPVPGNACRTDLELGRRDISGPYGRSHRRDDPRGRQGPDRKWTYR